MTLNLKNRQQVLLIAAIGLISVWAADTLAITPLLKSWRERNVRMAELRRSINEGEQLLGRETVIRERWESMRTNTLPQEVSAAESKVLRAFEKWSRESNMSITSVKPQWRRTEEEYTTLECRVDGFGSLATVTRFLYELEKDPLALKVDTVELSSRDNDGSQITLGLQVSGLILNSETQ